MFKSKIYTLVWIQEQVRKEGMSLREREGGGVRQKKKRGIGEERNRYSVKVSGNKWVEEGREGRIDWEEEAWLKGKKGKTGKEEGWKEETERETLGMRVVK